MSDFDFLNVKIDDFIKRNGELLFHYTSFEALFSIITGKELWLSNTSSMNDRLEVLDFINKVKDSITAALPNNEKVEDFFNSVYERQKTQYPYAMCFSSLRDDASQWERYGSNASGVCICFNSRALYMICAKLIMILNEVFYEYDVQNHQIHGVILLYLMNGIYNAGFSNEKGLIDNLWLTGSVRKHPSFKTENEIRMVTLWDSIPDNCRVEQIVANGIVKKVLKIDLKAVLKEVDISLSDLIDSVIIGPKSKQTEYDLRAFLDNHELQTTKIYKSECPLR